MLLSIIIFGIFLICSPLWKLRLKKAKRWCYGCTETEIKKSLFILERETGRPSPVAQSRVRACGSSAGSKVEKSCHLSPAPLSASWQKDSVLFNVWDIGGQASMSTVNQCFFTDKALYVVTWNLALGEEAVANLQTWLLNIEVSTCTSSDREAASPQSEQEERKVGGCETRCLDLTVYFGKTMMEMQLMGQI